MEKSEYLFPRRMDRREFLKLSGATTATMAFSAGALAHEGHEHPKPAVKIGSGYYTYTLDESWGEPLGAIKYGWGCGIVVDSRDNVYVHTRSTSSVLVFNSGGRFMEAWGDSFAKDQGTSADALTKTAHCVYWSKEGKDEFLYFTDHPRGIVFKTDLRGKVLMSIGNVPKESDTAFKAKFDNPTDVAVSANGDIYVCEGYGSQLVHRFTKDGLRLKTIGGKGKTEALFNTCHGIWINTLKREPEVYIADRANSRLQVFDLELNYKRTLTGNYRNPSCFYQFNDKLFIPDLASRVTIIDVKDKLVAHLGDGNALPAGDRDKHPELFSAPHALTLDSKGNLYVLEWLPNGRVRKFTHTPVGQPA